MLLGLSALCVTGCNWFNAVDDGKIPQGVIFYTGSPVVFYFVDEDGDDLVNKETPSTYPKLFFFYADEDTRVQAVSQIQTITQTSGGVSTEFSVYNDGSNWLWTDPEEDLTAFQSYMWGKTPNTSSTMLVYLGESSVPDSLQVQYKYRTPAEDPSLDGNWAVDITSVRYQGVEVFEHNENGKVFIVKPSHGETTVKVGSR